MRTILTKLVALLANCKIKWFKNLLIKSFIKFYNIDLQAAIKQNVADYNSFNDFFTRKINLKKRTFQPNPKQIICPIDGYINQIGNIDNQTLIQAKGKYFDLSKLLTNQLAGYIPIFTNGAFVTLYLSPANYHRIHMPITGKLQTMLYIPGKLFSVKPKDTKKIRELYIKNERVITIFATEIGPIAIILVGAMLIGSIATSWHGVITSANKSKQLWDYSKQNVTLQQLAELGRFQFGSTIILLFPNNSITWSNFVPNPKVLAGQPLGQIISSVSASK